ncbi:hypothetical protein [Streptomyces sp. BK340]|uniref:hypothetical protein n=1 Tax=Streptomyces sp. BK340 TaxID=2572903 RepID=UPI0016482EBE
MQMLITALPCLRIYPRHAHCTSRSGASTFTVNVARHAWGSTSVNGPVRLIGPRVVDQDVASAELSDGQVRQHPRLLRVGLRVAANNDWL